MSVNNVSNSFDARGRAKRQLGEQAMLRLTSTGIWSRLRSWLNGNYTDYETAASEFKQAGLYFSLDGNVTDAVDCYNRSVDLITLSPYTSYYERAKAFIDAATALQTQCPTQALEYLNKALDWLMMDGRVAMAADTCLKIAILLRETSNRNKCIETYETAANLFMRADKLVKSRECLENIAKLSIETGNFARAAELYRKLADDSITISRRESCSITSITHRLRSNVNYLNCALCHLGLSDIESARRIMRDHLDTNSRESDFLTKLVDACDTCNIDDFAEACQNFDRITILDNERITVLIQAKAYLSVLGTSTTENDDINLS
jgi:tetratricopeptide (TPR) repeat protein